MTTKLSSLRGSAPSSGTLSVSYGGTGTNTLVLNSVLLGNGTNTVQTVAPGTSGNLLISNGTTWVSQAAPWVSLASGTLVGTTDAQTLTNKTIVATAIFETKVALMTGAINLASGNLFTITISSNTTFSISNAPATGTVTTFVLEITNGGAGTITWWTGLKWVNGVAPTLSVSGRDTLGFYSHDGGTTWSGLVMGKDIK